MKKFLAIAIMLAASISASAQLYLGGSIGLNRNTSENETNLTIAPEIGYNLNSTWAIGGELAYNYKYDDGLSTNVFAIRPYARYTYYSCADNRVNLFVDGGFGLGFGKAKYAGESSDTVVLYSIGFKPGVSFKVNDKFTLLAHFGFLGYSGGNDTAKDAGYPETFGFDFSSMNLSLGMHYNF